MHALNYIQCAQCILLTLMSLYSFISQLVSLTLWNLQEPSLSLPHKMCEMHSAINWVHDHCPCKWVHDRPRPCMCKVYISMQNTLLTSECYVLWLSCIKYSKCSAFGLFLICSTMAPQIYYTNITPPPSHTVSCIMCMWLCTHVCTSTCPACYICGNITSHDIQVAEGEGYVYTTTASEVFALVNSRKTQCNKRSCFSLAMNTSWVGIQLPSTSNAREHAPGLKALRL